MAYPNPADLPSIRTDPNLQLMSQPGLNIGYLAFNNHEGRRSPTCGCARPSTWRSTSEAILDGDLPGLRRAGEEPDPADHVELQQRRSRTIRTIPAKAKALLAEAGFPNGFETTLWAMPVQRPVQPRRPAHGRDDAGRPRQGRHHGRASSATNGASTASACRTAEHDMALLGWTGDNGDPDNFFVPLAGCDAAKHGGGSASKWCNQQFEDLVQKAVSTDQPGRARQALRAGPGDHARGGAVRADRPLGGVPADAQERAWTSR